MYSSFSSFLGLLIIESPTVYSPLVRVSHGHDRSRRNSHSGPPRLPPHSFPGHSAFSGALKYFRRFSGSAVVAPEPEPMISVIPRGDVDEDGGHGSARKEERSKGPRRLPLLPRISSREVHMSQEELMDRIINEGLLEEQMAEMDYRQQQTHRGSLSRDAWSSSAAAATAGGLGAYFAVDVVANDITAKHAHPIGGHTANGYEETVLAPSELLQSVSIGPSFSEQLTAGDAISPLASQKPALHAKDVDGVLDRSDSDDASSSCSSGLSSGTMTPSGYGGQSGLTSGAMTPNWGTRFEGLESMVGSRRNSFSAVKGLVGGGHRSRDDELSGPSCLCIPEHHRLREDLYDIISHWSFDYA